MKTFVGIDLGSTTTKAVLLDEDRKVVGHGITNSRSNYATAARVASQEARVDGQFTLFRRALTEAHAQVELDTFLGALERAFRLEQFLEQLDDLEQTCVGQIQGERFAKVASGVKDFACRSLQAAAHGGARTLRARCQAKIRLFPRYCWIALPRPRRGGRARRWLAL